MSENISSPAVVGGLSAPPSHEVEEREHVTVIAARTGWRALNVREMWAYRELLYFLTWRDVKVRYKQTLLGAAWAILQPLMYMVVFVVVFFRIANAPSEGLPYPLFAFCGLVLWTFFATAITQAGNSVIGSEALITKVYFPRLAIPFAAVGAALFDFAITFVVLVIMAISYAYFSTEGAAIAFTWQLMLVPILVLLTVLAALGVGTFLAALNVSFRDFKHTIPFLVQLWLFATPAIYMGVEHEKVHDVSVTTGTHAPAAAKATTRGQSTAEVNSATASSAGESIAAPASAVHSLHGSPVNQKTHSHAPSQGAVPDWVQHLLKFNPMTGLVRSFRSAMLGQPMPWTHLLYSTVIVIATFLGGCFYYHRVEDNFADII